MTFLRAALIVAGKFIGACLVVAAFGIGIGLELVHWHQPQLTDRSFFLVHWRAMLLACAFAFAGVALWAVGDWADGLSDGRERKRRRAQERRWQQENRARIEREG